MFCYPDTPVWAKSVASDKNKTEQEGPLWKWWQLQAATEGCQGQQWCSAGEGQMSAGSMTEAEESDLNPDRISPAV